MASIPKTALLCWLALMCMVSSSAAMPQPLESTQTSPTGPARKCGASADLVFGLLCPNVKIRFPYKKNDIEMFFPAKNKHIYPFEYQAHKCCLHGCFVSGFRWMCNYKKDMPSCMVSSKYSEYSKARILRECHHVINSKYGFPI